MSVIEWLQAFTECSMPRYAGATASARRSRIGFRMYHDVFGQGSNLSSRSTPLSAGCVGILAAG